MKIIVVRYALQDACESYDPWWRKPALGLSTIVVIAALFAAGPIIEAGAGLTVLGAALFALMLVGAVGVFRTCEARFCLPKPARRFLRGTRRERKRLEERCETFMETRRAVDDDRKRLGGTPKDWTPQENALQSEVDAYVSRLREAAGPARELPKWVRRRRERLAIEHDEERLADLDWRLRRLGADATPELHETVRALRENLSARRAAFERPERGDLPVMRLRSGDDKVCSRQPDMPALPPPAPDGPPGRVTVHLDREGLSRLLGQDMTHLPAARTFNE